MINEQVYERLFRDNYAKLYYFAYDFIGDIDIARDIVSDVFVLVWDKRYEMDPGSNLPGYLYKSVRNKCLNHLQRTPHDLHFNDLIELSLKTEDTDQLLQMEDRIAEMNIVIDGMSPRTRHVLQECYYNNHSYREVADALGITVDGIKKHIVKAMALLRDHFNVKKQKK